MPASTSTSGFPGQRPTLLRQQADVDYQGARCRRPLLHQTKPARDEMDSSGPVQARHSNVAGRLAPGAGRRCGKLTLLASSELRKAVADRPILFRGFEN